MPSSQSNVNGSPVENLLAIRTKCDASSVLLSAIGAKQNVYLAYNLTMVTMRTLMLTLSGI